LTLLHKAGNFVNSYTPTKVFSMFNTRFFALILSLILSSTVVAQLRSINSIVGESSISEEDENKIKKYAIGWAQQLLSTDAELLAQAHTKLSNPLDRDVRITPYARSIYGKYLKEGFRPLLDPKSDNEMAAVIALQILSLLGTEQACGVLLDHADVKTENRPAMRLWASIGLGTSFLTGELPVDRIERYAKLLANFSSKEEQWFVLSRQFDSLAALQAIPNLDRSQLDTLEAISFELQTKSLIKLLDSIINSQGVDYRVQALPFIFPSLLLQIIEPSVNPVTKSETLGALLPSLIAFIEYAVTRDSTGDTSFLHNAYGGAAHSAGLLITRAIGSHGDDQIMSLWNNGDYKGILELVEIWKASQ